MFSIFKFNKILIFQSPPEVVGKAVETALECGYRHIDTAFSYLNEEGVGNGIKAWLSKTGKSREEIFVVTKVGIPY